MAARWAKNLILLITSNAQVLENIVAAFAFKFVNWHTYPLLNFES